MERDSEDFETGGPFVTRMARGAPSVPVLAPVTGPCDCVADATYHDDPNSTESDCVGSFGVTWTPSQNGICDKEDCPPEQPCTGSLTIGARSAEGEQCNWSLSITQPTGTTFGFRDQGFNFPLNDTMSCGASFVFDWVVSDQPADRREDPIPVHLGYHEFECQDCPD